MTQSKGSFTPGPWSVSGRVKLIGDPDSRIGQHNHYVANILPANPEAMGDVCYIQSADHVEGGITRDEAAANARLIAAAPALLEALKRTTELLANANRSTDRPSETVWRAVTEARAAIQSATGEG